MFCLAFHVVLLDPPGTVSVSVPSPVFPYPCINPIPFSIPFTFPLPLSLSIHTIYPSLSLSLSLSLSFLFSPPTPPLTSSCLAQAHMHVRARALSDRDCSLNQAPRRQPSRLEFAGADRQIPTRIGKTHTLCMQVKNTHSRQDLSANLSGACAESYALQVVEGGSHSSAGQERDSEQG